MNKRKRPPWVNGKTGRFETACGKLYVTVNSDEENIPFEVFSQIGKSGGCAQATLQGMARMASLALRYGAPMNEVYKQWVGISCHKSAVDLCCVDAIGKALKMIDDSNKKEGTEK